MKRAITLLVAGFAFCIYAFSQPKTLPDPEPYFVAVLADDFEQSLVWYQKILGFELLDKTQNKERGFSIANLQRGSVLLEIITLDSAFTKDQLSELNPDIGHVNGLFKIGFRVTNFDQWLAFLKTAEVAFSGDVVVSPQSGKRMVIIKDPDGNRIQLFEK